MHWFVNMKIRSKLIIGFTVVIGFTILTSFIANNAIERLNNAIGDMYNTNLVPTADVANANMQAIYHNRLLYLYIIEAEQTEMDKISKLMGERAEKMQQLLDKYRNTHLTEKEASLLKQLDSSWSVYIDVAKKVMAFSYASDNKSAMEVMQGDAAKAFKISDDLLSEIVDVNVELGKKSYADSNLLHEQVTKTSYALLLLAIVLSAIFGYLIIRSIVQPLKNIVDSANRMAANDFSVKLDTDAKDETGDVARAFVSSLNATASVIEELKTLSAAIYEGQLSVRADINKHQGDFKNMLVGVNQILDSIIQPLNTAADYVEQISKGDIPAKITDTYNGDFSTIKNNLNTCIDAVGALVKDADMLSKAAVNGQLDIRADVSRHHGDYRKIIEGVNNTLDVIVQPVQEVGKLLERMAQGDLSVLVQDHYAGDLERFKTNANTSVERLRDLISNIKEATDAINNAAKEISAGNTNLSQRTEEQAASLEETAASMEQLAATVKQNVENARHANQMASDASGIAAQGGEVVGEVVTTMTAINNSSLKIVDIISVIDGIAFQTNILALNAAVEAARAGEQGRGFAVVAVEVRNLAQRSAAAASEIKLLISDSVDKVDVGAKLVEKAGGTTQEIVASVNRVTNVMAEITKASEEQGNGIDQVNLAITQMDQVTQQNAALVEQAAAAAESLEEQASALQESVSLFKLSENQTFSSKSAPVPKAATKPSVAGKPVAAVSSDQWTEF